MCLLLVTLLLVDGRFLVCFLFGLGEILAAGGYWQVDMQGGYRCILFNGFINREGRSLMDLTHLTQSHPFRTTRLILSNHLSVLACACF